MRDLFLALIDENNARKHPLLVVLLYTYCPRAVRWWVTGAEPVLPPDPVWMALEDMATGRSLRAALVDRELDTAIDDAYRYVRFVHSFRQNYRNVDAPERTDIFGSIYEQQRIRHDFQVSARVEKAFGSWDGFYSYVRTYAFLFEDWARGIGFDVETADVEAVSLSLRFAGISRLPPVRWPAWLWHQGESSPREVVGVLARHGQQDALRFSLLDRADRVEGKWAGVPETYALDPERGTAAPFVPPVDEQHHERLFGRLVSKAMLPYYHEVVKNGPYPPLAALTAPERCAGCGFRHICYEQDGTLQQEMFLE